MAIDVERMKSGVDDLKKVLEEAEKIRSWAYTNGKSSEGDGEEYSELLCKLDTIITPFQECGWDIKKLFKSAATEPFNTVKKNQNEVDWEAKVNEHLNNIM